MGWKIEYFERENLIQPAEIFEDELFDSHCKLARVIKRLERDGDRLGGGLIEKCR
jgi:hypothetical protein